MKFMAFSMIGKNTLMLNLFICGAIFGNALIDLIKTDNQGNTKSSVIVIPDSFLPLVMMNGDKGQEIARDEDVFPLRSNLKKYLAYSVGVMFYFVTLVFIGILFSRGKSSLVIVQYLLFVACIFTAMRILVRSRLLAILLSTTICLAWFISHNTSYRWIINNAIVLLIPGLTRYVKFKNFISLQIFLWLAFLYDVLLLGSLPLLSTSTFLSLSVPCRTLLCDISTRNLKNGLPTVFSIRLGPSNEHVYLGAGDVIIGAFIANFTASFFNSKKHLAFSVFLYSLAILFLMGLNSSQMPALLTIVPFCSGGIIISAVCSKRAQNLMQIS